MRVYGVDDRFWRFHGVEGVSGPASRDAYVSPALASQIGAAAGSVILVRVQRPTDIPLESLHGRRNEVGPHAAADRAPRAPVEPRWASLRSMRSRATSVPCSSRCRGCSRTCRVEGRVNTLLVSGGDPESDATAAIEQAVRASAQLEDVGLNTKVLTTNGPALSIGADAGLLDAPRAAAVTKALDGSGLSAQPMFAYLANTLRVGDREIPYSLVTALNDPNVRTTRTSERHERSERRRSFSTDWAARDLNAKPGDSLTMEYYLYEDGSDRHAHGDVPRPRIVPLSTGDRDMAPTFPGISDSPTLESTGIRRSRWTFVACARRTSASGSSTERRRRPS